MAFGMPKWNTVDIWSRGSVSVATVPSDVVLKVGWQTGERTEILPLTSALNMAASAEQIAEGNVQLSPDEAHARISDLETQLAVAKAQRNRMNEDMIEAIHQREKYKNEKVAYERNIKSLRSADRVEADNH
jgi:hypothetical protein